jgi:hypothetical protein
MIDATTPIMTRTTGYAHFRVSSGMKWKFIPYRLAIKERGMKIVDMIVNTFMISFNLLLVEER